MTLDHEPAPSPSALALVLGRREEQVPFDKPWQLRVFALAVAACEAGEFPWSEFQEALTDAIKDAEEDQSDFGYYEHFVAALETVLARHGHLSMDGLDQRVKSILAKPPHKHHVARYDPISIDPPRA